MPEFNFPNVIKPRCLVVCLIKLETIAQDGMRVRAHAVKCSFDRQGSLEESRVSAEAFFESAR